MLMENSIMNLNANIFITEYGSYQDRVNLKSDPLFRATNAYWNQRKLNSARRVGCISELLSIFKPKSYQEWLEDYIQWSYDQKKVEHIDQYDCLFLYQANCLSDAFHISLKQAMQYCIYRVLDQSWNGYLKELKAVEQIQALINDLHANKKYIVKHSDWNIDKNFAIDAEVFLVENGQESLIMGIQLKPASFMNAYKYTGWGRVAMKQNLTKQLQYVHEKHVKTCFWTYEQIAQKQVGTYSDFSLLETL